jgi:hypothetical protein
MRAGYPGAIFRKEYRRRAERGKPPRRLAVFSTISTMAAGRERGSSAVALACEA